MTVPQHANLGCCCLEKLVFWEQKVFWSTLLSWSPSCLNVTLAELCDEKHAEQAGTSAVVKIYGCQFIVGDYTLPPVKIVETRMSLHFQMHVPFEWVSWGCKVGEKMCRAGLCYKNSWLGPGRVAQLVGALSCTLKCGGFDPQLGHVPEANDVCLSVCLPSPPHFMSL